MAISAPGGGPDVVVVGAGTAGCALAARLADAGQRVLLLEAGPVPRGPDEWPAEVRDPASLAATASGHPLNWDLPGQVVPGRAVRVPRGRIAGGSSALNAAVWLRATPADLDGWAAAGTPLWSHAAVLPAFRRSEADADFGSAPGHGADGPVPVRRLPAGPAAAAFAAAAAELGFAVVADKNDGAGTGYGPIPFNVDGGVRVNAAMAYLEPRRTHPYLAVRGGVDVRRVLVERGRAVGVLTDRGPVRAGQVVLSAGAVGSAHLLLVSGLGPAADLAALGIDVLADLPVGAASSDHPLVYLPYRTAPGLTEPALPLHGVLHAPVPGGEVEVLPWLRRFGADPEPLLGIGLQHPVARGRLTLDPRDPAGPPLLDYRYLAEEADRGGLREGVRTAAALLRTAAVAGTLGPSAAVPDAVLDDDAALDAWIAAGVGTAVHLSGTAPMGPDDEAGAVVDEHLRVRGVAGLRVVDTSVLPSVPSRGTAATAVMIGERAAELLTSG
ncbi:mycofactocin system GMC family oxidoreductase MftG [Blastococcus sp. TML/M2B]|uniref:mycofactocin dehydrogenase MftG n=1 Tax=unclassified Blastococcus TaxID=2619396 RepID=UPI00190CB9BE|nr:MULTISPECIES: mycofactocin system GMC family oxidoreductase MftG [unclassified Blastococcus]MBN1094171.1 mycofactocin system GMC family oxidoreductase MftG [Blastococcus sp. TML/M2B]MBN1095712.1 mycofactocin system GMC family oxidoreductase MftG [Blastococcus sp. TML/C7B]